MNIFPLWCDRPAQIKASFIQIHIVHTCPVYFGSLGFHINGVWNRGVSHLWRPANSSMIWLSVKVFFRSTMSAGFFCVGIWGMRHHFYTNGSHKPCASFKNLQKMTTDFSVLVLQGYFICVLISKREADLR